MCAKLNDNIVVHRLASDLGLRESADPVKAIINFCHRRTKTFLKDDTCSTLAALLDLLANKLGTRIVEIHSDEELKKLQRRYINRGEQIFATLDQELATTDTFGITLRLQNHSSWEGSFVSVIDCRDRKSQRKYHTKWHELGHLFILTDQTRLAFRRSHDSARPKSAEESLVDSIAGELSFYPPLVKPYLRGQISFKKIEQIREALCPESSMYSAVLNLSKLWPKPCIWLEAKLAAKKNTENIMQGAFAFKTPPQKDLRAVHVSANSLARDLGFNIIPRFRIPKESVIKKIFANNISFAEADENLDWWESSDGTRLDTRAVHVEVRRIGETIHALIVPN